MEASNPFRVVVASTVNAIELYSNEIDNRKPTVIGFDIEGCTSDSVDIISIAEIQDSEPTVYLFQLSDIPVIPRPLRQILSSERILKSGCGLINDAHRLLAKGITLTGTVELSHLARIRGLPQNLKDLWNALFPKGYRLRSLPSTIHSEWNKPLTPSLIEYASYDAYASLMCALEILGVKTETSEIISEDTDCKHYRLWIAGNITGSRSMASLINQTVSSYGPWVKKYSQEVRAKLARYNLMLGINEMLYVYNEMANEFSPRPTSEAVKANVVAKRMSPDDIRFIIGLRYTAACNYLFNSSKLFNMLSSELRLLCISKSIELLVQEGKIKLIEGIIYEV